MTSSPGVLGDKIEATFAELHPRCAVVGVEPTAPLPIRQVLYPCSRHRHSPKVTGDKMERTFGCF